MDRVDSMQEQMGNVNRFQNFEKTKRNARGQKHCNKIDECFNGLISRLNLAEERISEFEDISIEISKTVKQREK